MISNDRAIEATKEANELALRSLSDGPGSSLPELGVECVDRRDPFLRRVFEAAEKIRLHMQEGTIAQWQCELRIGDSHVSIGQSLEGPEPRRLLAQLFVADSAAVFARAVEAGAKAVVSVDDPLLGASIGRLIDPFGNVWIIRALGEEPSALEARASAREQ
jgi:PhnB protein